MIKEYDVAVIGSGPAGQRAAVQAAKTGKKVVVIDNRMLKLGGVSLHTGTIPSKTLREAVLYIKGLKRKYVYGSSRLSRKEVSLEDLTEKVNSILEYEVRVIERQLSRNGVDVIYGEAVFEDRNSLSIMDHEWNVSESIRAEKIIIATGTLPRRPDDIEFDHEVIFDSDFIFSHKSNIKKLPGSMIVYGAGVIGIEYAGMFGALGCRVTVVDDHEEMFPFIDRDIVSLLKKFYIDLGVDFHFREKYRSLSRTKNGKGILITESGKEFTADVILFSKGRTPAVGHLGLAEIGVATGERDTIKVNSRFQTSAGNIFACGDVIGFPALASTSSEQGRRAARFALGLRSEKREEKNFPFAIYSIPELSSIGKTVQQLEQENAPFETGIAHYNEVAKAAISGDDRGALKILFDPSTRRILGIHIIGEQAAEIVHIGQVVMMHGGTLDFFIKNIFNYPTWAEAYRVAAFNGLNKLG